MSYEARYGLLDRMLHRFAFRADTAQRALADVEELVYEDALDSVRLETPVFISGLPRSGTTILLELLWETDRFATHTYRDMPFVLCPMLWNRFSRLFTRDGATTERAHGDGLPISPDSPEAFEEMIWKRYWPDNYRSDRILPWRPFDTNREFEVFFAKHARKMVVLRRRDPDEHRRYLSKNNVNIARLAALPGLLGSGVVVVPFREPVQHAASMLRQHRRFSRLHAEDDFLRRYMEAIGHHEFGAGLKLVDFGGWLSSAGDPLGLEFWVRYWTAAYRFVLDHGSDSTVLVSYDGLTRDPKRALGDLAEAIGIEPSVLVPGHARVRPPRSHDADREEVSDEVLRAASEVYDELTRRTDVG